jgi:hypothetical protein
VISVDADEAVHGVHELGEARFIRRKALAVLAVALLAFAVEVKLRERVEVPGYIFKTFADRRRCSFLLRADGAEVGFPLAADTEDLFAVLCGNRCELGDLVAVLLGYRKESFQGLDDGGESSIELFVCHWLLFLLTRRHGHAWQAAGRRTLSFYATVRL